jgi:hypothetical protein
LAKRIFDAPGIVSFAGDFSLQDSGHFSWCFPPFFSRDWNCFLSEILGVLIEKDPSRYLLAGGEGPSG